MSPSTMKPPRAVQEPWPTSAAVSSFPRHSELLGAGFQDDLLLPSLLFQAPAPLSATATGELCYSELVQSVPARIRGPGGS